MFQNPFDSLRVMEYDADSRKAIPNVQVCDATGAKQGYNSRYQKMFPFPFVI